LFFLRDPNNNNNNNKRAGVSLSHLGTERECRNPANLGALFLFGNLLWSSSPFSAFVPISPIADIILLLLIPDYYYRHKSNSIGNRHLSKVQAIINCKNPFSQIQNH
jgi:hypothetical protein